MAHNIDVEYQNIIESYKRSKGILKYQAIQGDLKESVMVEGAEKIYSELSNAMQQHQEKKIKAHKEVIQAVKDSRNIRDVVSKINDRLAVYGAIGDRAVFIDGELEKLEEIKAELGEIASRSNY